MKFLWGHCTLWHLYNQPWLTCWCQTFDSMAVIVSRIVIMIHGQSHMSYLMTGYGICQLLFVYKDKTTKGIPHRTSFIIIEVKHRLVASYMEKNPQIINRFFYSICTAILCEYGGYKSSVSCKKGPTCHVKAWRVGPFWQDTIDMCMGFFFQVI